VGLIKMRWLEGQPDRSSQLDDLSAGGRRAGLDSEAGAGDKSINGSGIGGGVEEAGTRTDRGTVVGGQVWVLGLQEQRFLHFDEDSGHYGQRWKMANGKARKKFHNFMAECRFGKQQQKTQQKKQEGQSVRSRRTEAAGSEMGWYELEEYVEPGSEDDWDFGDF
jgi:hypothetical protein